MRRKWLGVLAVVGVVTSGCSVRSLDEDSSGRRIVTATPASLRAFESCDPLLDELQTLGAEQVTAFGLEDGTTGLASGGLDIAAPGALSPPTSTAATDRSARDAAESASGEQSEAGTEWGGTNLQELGVDEPDTVKTDGSLVLTVVGDTLRIIDVSAAEPTLLGEVPAAGGAQLLVDGETALILAAGADGTTALTAVDIGDPSEPAVRQQLELDGFFVSARQVDGMVRVVTTTGGPAVDFVEPTASRAAETARRRNAVAVRDSEIDDWLPRFRTADAAGRTITEASMVECANTFVPEDPVSVSMVNLVSVDLRADVLEPTDGASVVGAGETVYASNENLYVTSSTFDAATRSTDVHKFSITGRTPATYLASGRVGGWVLDQFALSEHAGDLRVAVTSQENVGPVTTLAGPDRPAVGGTQSSVIVLRERNGELTEAGRVDGLGRGEQIRSVRFMGDVGYVVTFRQTDPLYTVDLSDPAAPRVVGELKIPGYSSYLHPAGDGRLIGIGQDASEQGTLIGLQLALFDVSDPAAPRQLQKQVLPGASSLAEGEHHAFLWWAGEALAVVPLSDYGGGEDDGVPFEGAVGFSVSDGAIEERGRIGHAGGGVPIERFVVVNGRILALSIAGLSTTEPATFAPLTWLSFD